MTFNDNERMILLNRVGNIMAKVEIAHNKQFHHVFQCFQKSSLQMWQRGKNVAMGNNAQNKLFQIFSTFF